jgi:hypothetical protein
LERVLRTKWFRLRLVFAVAVLALLAYELFGHRYWFVGLVQAILIAGIIVTSALDLRDIRHQRR